MNYITEISKAGIIYLLLTKLNDTTFNHFPVQVITLTGTFSNTSENRETTYREKVGQLQSVNHKKQVPDINNERSRIPTMGLGNIVDQLHDKDSFTHSCTTEKTNFPTPLVRCKQIHDLSDINHRTTVNTHYITADILIYCIQRLHEISKDDQRDGEI
jgi:hypothetical protein